MTRQRPQPWSTEENAALVALYFHMLDKALSGRPYIKAELIRSAQNQPTDDPTIRGGAGLKAAPLCARSKPSIEFKLMNATAAHEDITDGVAGRVTVTMDGYGYRAMPNYQAALKDAMREALDARANPPAFDDQAWCDAG